MVSLDEIDRTRGVSEGGWFFTEGGQRQWVSQPDFPAAWSIAYACGVWVRSGMMQAVVRGKHAGVVDCQLQGLPSTEWCKWVPPA